MVVEGNVMQSYPMNAPVSQYSPISPILFTPHTAGLKTRVEDRVQGAEGQFVENGLRWVTTGNNVNQMVKTLETCTAESNDRASSQDLEFNTAKTETAIVIPRIGHKKHILLKLGAKFNRGNGFI